MPIMLGESFAGVLVAAQTGAGWAFTRLWEDLGPVVTGYLRVNGAHDPEDLASETFIGVFRGIHSFEGPESKFRSWVLTIAHRRLLDERRARSRRPSTPVPDSHLHTRVGGDAEADAMTRLEGEEVIELLEGLTEEQRAVLTLRIIAGLTIEEVAEVVGKRPGAVKALQRRGVKQLRKMVSEEGVPL